jgi:hypothetical protein
MTNERRAHATFGLLAVSAACWACAEGGTGGATVAVRDSAGIAIVESSAAPDTIVAAQTISIGAVEGDEAYTFNRIAGLVVSETGLVYVLDSGDNVVKVYDAAGTHVRTFGGEGEGPAEFRAASRLALEGDTVIVYDYRLQKLARFTPDGELLRSDRTELPIMTFGFPARLEPVAGGFLAVMSTGCSLPRPDDLRPQWRLLLLDRNAAVRDTLALLHDRAQIALYGERFCSGLTALAAPTHALAVRPDGLLAYGDGDPNEILLLRIATPDSAAAGAAASPSPPYPLDPRDVWAMPQPERIIRGTEPRAAVTADEKDAFMAQHTAPDTTPAGALDFERASVVETAIDSLGLPTEWPAFTSLMFDDEGRLWAGRPARAEAVERAWVVYAEDGASLALVRLPPGFTLRAFHDGIAWGTERDELDVSYVRGYRVDF